MATPRTEGREVELKLAVPEGSTPALAGHPVSRSTRATAAKRRHEVTTYFDTSDQALARRGLSLRVRHADGRHVQTLEAHAHGNVAADRGEWEWPVEHDTPEPALLARTPVAGRLPPTLDLAPVFSTEIDRTTRILRLEDGTVIEAALDEGAVVAGAARQPVHELELELRAGSPALLYRLALELHAAVPLHVAVESQAARGHRLRTGAAPPVHKAATAARHRGTPSARRSATPISPGSAPPAARVG